jgi:branched-chain amino acid transport system permease protein
MQNVVFGILTGSILAIATIGFSMVRQTEGFLHIAHGQYLALGAFLGLFFLETFSLNVFIAGLLSVLAVGLLGVAFSKIVFEPVKPNGPLALLFSSIGLAYILYGAMLVVFGASVRTYPVRFGSVYSFGSVSITLGEITIVAIAALSVLILHVFLTRTGVGMWIRAVASNPELARVRGVRTKFVSSVVWFIASGLAGLAGVLIGIIGSVNSEIGWFNILIILSAAVMGGLGSIYGVIGAGLILGLAMDLSALVIPTAYRTVVAFAALVLVLLLRPEGLFSLEGRRQAA